MTASNGQVPPEWVYPFKVRAVVRTECDRDVFIDRRSIVYVFRGKHAYNANVELPFVRDAALGKEALYLRTFEGLYRKVGGPSTIGQIAERLPPTFAQTVVGGVLINLAVVPHEWDAQPAAHVSRVGYRLRSVPGSSQTHVEWIRISRRCLRDILPKLA